MHKSLEPIKIGNLSLKNRIVLSSMCVFFCDQEGYINDVLTEYVRERARGGVGLIIMPGSPHGKVGPGRPAISDNSYIPGWKKLADMVHSYGGKLFCQLHPGKFQAGRGFAIDDINEYTEEYIDALIESYADGAVRARKAGVDGVEIHGAHAHEVAQFMSPFYNRRTDAYGGSTEGRALFAQKIVRRIKEKAGQDYPLCFRISGDEHVPGGRRIEETIEIAKLLEAAGADMLHVSCGMPESEYMISAPMDVQDMFNVENAAKVKAAVNVPVVAVNRITSIEEADQVIESGSADLCAMARANLADPDLIAKAEGRVAGPVRRCIGCNQGCRDASLYKKIRCMQNPRLGFENVFNFVPATEEEKKLRVMIVGAGPAGLEAAYELSVRGFNIEIYEKNSYAGGLVNLAAMPPRKENMREIINFRVEALKAAGVEIQYNTEVTADFIREKAPDVLILATGSEAFVPPIPGIKGANIATGDAVLKGEVKLPGKKIAIIGGGLVGCETAEALTEQGYKVDVIEMSDTLGQPLNLSRRHFMLKDMTEKGVKVHMLTKVMGIELPRVTVSTQNYTYDIEDVDGVVIAAGRKSVNGLAEEIKDITNMRVYVIGDANEPSLAINAISNGARIAAKI